MWKFRTKFSDSVCNDLKGHCTLSLKFLYAFFSVFFRIRHPFLSKCLLRMWKRRKLNLIRIFLWRTKVSEAVCKRHWHNMRSYLFSTCENFGHSVQWPLSLQCLFSKNALKGMVNTKRKFHHYLITFHLLLVTKQLTVATDFHSLGKNKTKWKSMAYRQLSGYQFSSKYILLSSTEERNSYRFGTSGK